MIPPPPLPMIPPPLNLATPSTLGDTFDTASTVQNIDTITPSAGTPFPLWMAEITALVSIRSGPDISMS